MDGNILMADLGLGDDVRAQLDDGKIPFANGFLHLVVSHTDQTLHFLLAHPDALW